MRNSQHRSIPLCRPHQQRRLCSFLGIAQRPLSSPAELSLHAPHPRGFPALASRKAKYESNSPLRVSYSARNFSCIWRLNSTQSNAFTYFVAMLVHLPWASNVQRLVEPQAAIYKAAARIRNGTALRLPRLSSLPPPWGQNSMRTGPPIPRARRRPGNAGSAVSSTMARSSAGPAEFAGGNPRAADRAARFRLERLVHAGEEQERHVRVHVSEARDLPDRLSGRIQDRVSGPQRLAPLPAEPQDVPPRPFRPRHVRSRPMKNGA